MMGMPPMQMPRIPGITVPPPEPKPAVTLKRDPAWLELVKNAENRSAYQLGLQYFEDDTKEEYARIFRQLQPDSVVLISSNENAPIRSFFLHNNLTVTGIEEKALQTETLTIKPTQLLIIADDVKLGEDTTATVKNFVASGGCLLSFDSAISTVSRVFEGLVRPKQGQTTIDKPVEVSFIEGPDMALFQSYQTGAKLLRRPGLRRFQVLNTEKVQVLAKETFPVDLPFAIKFQEGSGAVYHFSTRYVTKEYGDIWATKVIGNKLLADKIDNREDFKVTTKMAFKCANESGFHQSMTLAIATQPFIHFLARVLISTLPK